MAANNVMVDLETLATSTDCVILTLGVVKFDPFENYVKTKTTLQDLETYYARITLESQANRAINDDTVEWWSKQNSAAKEEAFGEDGRIPLEQALDELHKFMWQCTSKVWCQGLTFDLPILEHAYRSFGKSMPWTYGQARDSRTIQDLCLVRTPSELTVTTHNALEDCYKQIVNVQLVLQQLGVEKFVR